MSFTNTLILTSLLRAYHHQQKHCPPEKLIRQATKSLYTQALTNKTTFALFHLIECPRCRALLRPSLKKKLTMVQKISIFHTLKYAQEKQHLTQLFKKKKLQALFFKDTAEKLAQPLFLAQDADVLISAAGAEILNSWFLKNGYSKIAYPPKEITYLSKGEMNVDVHTLLAYPHFDSLTTSEISVVKQFSADILARTKYGNFTITDWKFLLLSLCIRFLHNDLMTGLGLLFEIGQQAQKVKSPASWHQFLEFAKKYRFKNQALFCIALSGAFFGFSFFTAIAQFLPARIHLLIKCLPIHWFAEFPELKNWHAKKYQAKVALIRKNRDLINIIIHEKTSFFRLVRPGFVLFMAQALIMRSKEKFFLSEITLIKR